jgi:putative redox protein
MTDKTVEVHHDSGMRLVARTGSGHQIVMDDGKGDTGARPTELLIAALGGCTGMDVVSILRKKRQDVNRFDVRVGATQRSAYPQIFSDIEMVVEVEGPDVTVAAVREAIELAARKYCSVGAMLAAGETAIHHRYRVIGTGAVPFDEAGEVSVSGPLARPEAP